MDGWIKFYRQFLDWEWYKDIPTKVLFIHFLLRANNKPTNWKGIVINRGQMFTSLNHLSQETGLSIKQIRISLDKLKRTSEVAIIGASNGTMITVCKYDSYQALDSEKGQAKGQAKGRSKGNKQESKEDNINILSWRNDFKTYLDECNAEYKKFLDNEELIKQQEYFNPGINVKKSIWKGYTNYWSKETGWKKKKASRTVDIDWHSTILNSIVLNKVYYTKEELAAL